MKFVPGHLIRCTDQVARAIGRRHRPGWVWFRQAGDEEMSETVLSAPSDLATVVSAEEVGDAWVVEVLLAGEVVKRAAAKVLWNRTWEVVQGTSGTDPEVPSPGTGEP